jgi:hypothetical protein
LANTNGLVRLIGGCAPAAIKAKAGEGSKGLAFIAAHNVANAASLPAPSMHVFYGTRVADVADALPKYRHYVSSQFAFLKLLLTRGRA